MKRSKLIYATIFLSLLFSSCQNDNEDIDDEKPLIDISGTDTFPLACDTLYFGEPFTMIASFSDNVALGSFSLDIHNNFDHHSHSTEVIECDLADKKDPVNPYTLIQDFEIPDGSASYKTNLELTLPSSNEDGLFDEGDYHFHINLVDQTGWATQLGVGVKLMHR